MSYTALYRKFRPLTFEDVKGQDHIVTALRNQITSGRIGHAYLFTGTRGTGKTTVAKIFARAVNCPDTVEGSPCNICASCEAILGGSSMNVVEIDAASNNGVDNIRQIREEVQYSPTEGRYRVYIIDEVHMLSIGAFNALLKTLEEPPEYVIFILATTEVHKIPITILSRCQRYDFHRISITTIEDRLRDLMEVEKVSVEPRALRSIARAADGSMRDGLSILDQCLAFFMGQTLTYDNVLDVLGTVDTEVFRDLLQDIIQGDVTGCIHIIDQVMMQGRELGQFLTDFVWYLRNLMLIQSSAGNLEAVEEFIDASMERLQEMEEESHQVDSETLIRYIRILSETVNQIKFSTVKRVLLEIALIKMAKPQMEQDLSSLIQRMEQMERQLAQGIVPASGIVQSAAPQEAAALAPAPVQKIAQAVPEDVQHVVDHWHEIAGQLDTQIRLAYEQARFAVEGDRTLLAVFEDPMMEALVNGEDKLGAVNQVIQNTTGKDIRLMVRHTEGNRTFDDDYSEIQKRVHMPMEEEDF